jgi:hypothetical protein
MVREGRLGQDQGEVRAGPRGGKVVREGWLGQDQGEVRWLGRGG